MATETPAHIAAPARRAPGWRPSGPESSRALSFVAVASVVLCVGLAVAGQLSLVTAAAVVLTAVAVTAYAAWQSFASFICGAIALRPVLDLTASQRSGALGVTGLFGLAVLAVSLGWLWLNRRSVRLHASGLTLALVGLVGAMTLASIGGSEPTESIPVVLRVATGVVVFVVCDVMLHLGTVTFRRLALSLAASFVIPLSYPALGLVGVSVTKEKDHVEALASVFFLSNNFAYFLLLGVLVAGAAATMLRGRARIVSVALFLLTTAELVLTETRGAWVAAVVGLLVIGALVSRRMLVAVALGVVLATLFVPPVTERVQSLAPGAGGPRSESSLSWRFGQWDTLLPLTEASPVIGVGPGESVRLTGKEPHNDYVRALVETGVIGLVVYLGMFWVMLRTAGRVLRRLSLRPPRRRRSGPLPDAPVPDAPQAVFELATKVVLVASSAYVVGIIIGSTGENLIDNVTFLWSALPVLALLTYAMDAPVERLRLSRSGPSAAELSAPQDPVQGLPVAPPAS